MPDRIEALRQAADARHAATMSRATVALETLARRPEPITFAKLADAAGVSRSWLYRQPDLRQTIERLRQRTPGRRERSVPSRQQATSDSLRQQLHAAREEITRLHNENRALKDQLARKLGAARAVSRIGPCR